MKYTLVLCLFLTGCGHIVSVYMYEDQGIEYMELEKVEHCFAWDKDCFIGFRMEGKK